MIDPALMGPVEHMDDVTYHDPLGLISDVGVLSTPPHPLTTQNSIESTGGFDMDAIDPNLDSALQAPVSETLVVVQDAQIIDPAITTQARPPQAELPRLKTLATNTPDLDKSFSPLTASADEQSTEAPQSDLEIAHPPANVDSNIQRSAERPRINDVVHVKPEPLIDSAVEIDHRRHSSTATGVSPKQEEIMSPILLSRRSSSNTSGTTHRAAAGLSETIVVSAHADTSNPKMNSIETASGPMVKTETTSPPHARHFDRASTEGSSLSDADADERLARELQAAEHGLRRRASVRAS